MHSTVSLPNLELALAQHVWLRSARSRVLRQCNIQASKIVVELGCGWGLSCMEFAQRCSARIVGIDRDSIAISHAQQQLPTELADQVEFIYGDVQHLPLPDQSADIVFCQCAFLWIRDRSAVLRESLRVLKVGGWLVAIEPDYGGLMDWPLDVSLRPVWLDSLRRAGAEPMVGRCLFAELSQHSELTVQSRFLDYYESPREESLGFLKQLPLDDHEAFKLERVRQILTQSNQRYVSHLPYWLLTAQRTCR